MITHLIDAANGKHPIGAKRSSKWPSVRKKHLDMNPACAVCGGLDKVEVHHITPFHLQPELELEADNLITLCEGSKAVNCHLFFGHLGTYKSFNINVRADAFLMYSRVKERPE